MKKLLYGLFVIFFLFIIFAFFRSSQNTAGNSGQDQTQPGVGGSIVIGINADVESFNPLFGESVIAQEISHLILLGLADLNDQSEFEPELAESWESSADNLKLTYSLRKDLLWSDGVPITAEDVKFTFDLLMDKNVASPRQGVTEYIKNVSVNNAHSISFEFSEAYPAQIFDTAGEILPKHILEKVERKSLRAHDFGRNPLASGPFKLNSWVSQQYIELVPNENYFGEKPFLERIIFKIVPDKTNLLLQLKSGEIDMMTGVPPAEINNILEDNKDINIYQIDGRVYYFVGYNEKNPLFAQATVRRALTKALDRNKIIEALLYGYGRPCLGPLPPMIKWAYNDEVEDIKYDLSEAKLALNNEGWSDSDGDGWLDKNGTSFEFTLKTSAGNQIKADLAIIVQEQLRKLGVKVNIENLEWTTLLKQLQNKEFDACINGWSASYYIDPTPIFHSTATNLFNFISYANPLVDNLIESGREEMDRKKAAAIWKEFQHELYKDQPYTFMFWIDKAVAVNSRFKNVTPIALSSIYNLEKWFLATNI